MAASIPVLTSGQQLPGLPAEAWNRFRAATLAVEQQQKKTGAVPLKAGKHPSLKVDVVRVTAGSDLPTFSIVGLNTTAADLPASTATLPELPLRVEAVATAEGKPFAVLDTTLDAAADSVAVGVYSGLALCVVDVTNAKHETAGPIAADNDKLESGKPGAALLWTAQGEEADPVDRLGEQWAIIDIGATPEERPAVILTRCQNTFQTLSVYDAEIPGTVLRLSDVIGATVVARICDSPGSLVECWQISGVDYGCAAGDCISIKRLVFDCNACNQCFKLTNCLDGGDVLVARGVEWHEYEGQVVRIEGEVDVCRAVTDASNCDQADDYVLTEAYPDCSACDYCYELTNCNDVSDVLHLSNDLVKFWNRSGGDPRRTFPGELLNEILTIEGKCYEITDWDTCGVTPDQVDLRESKNIWYTLCSTCACYKFEPCPGNGEATYYARHAIDAITLADLNLEDYVGQVVRTDRYAADECWLVTRSYTCGTVLSEATTHKIYESYADCDHCLRYGLSECPGGGGGSITTYSDLSEFYPDGNIIIKRQEDGLCYTINSSNPPGGTDVPVTVAYSYETCPCCNSPRYEFVKRDCGQCDGCGDGGGGAAGASTVVADGDFGDSIGQYWKIEGTCYENIGCTTDPTTGETVECGPYPDCPACAAAAVFIEVVTNVNLDTINNKLEQTKKRIQILGVCSEADTDVADTTECP